MSVAIEPGSFRDPSGFLFRRDSTLFRQVQQSYASEYDLLMSSGLYEALTSAGLLVAHSEANLDKAAAPDAHRILQPDTLSFISYPYEWCFTELKDAALATLQIQKEALRFDMSLKDSSAYNIQFRDGNPILIDTLSFETYKEGLPWVAYRQFCQHFLAPLALMCKSDIRLGQLLRVHLDGIPLDLASRLLPWKTRLNSGLLAHIHLHAAAQRRSASTQSATPKTARGMSRTALLGLIDSLESTVRRLDWIPAGTVWADYYSDTNYSETAMAAKRQLVANMLGAIESRPKAVWDLGANTGLFSRVASEAGAEVISWDADPAAVEKNYLACRSSGDTRILPLLQDFTNPSPDLGWALQERQSLMRRGPADAVMALALVHHLAIGNNVPLPRIAQALQAISRWLIIEFVPKSDSQVQRLLASREDIFTDYTRTAFESAFHSWYETIESADIPGSDRTLYLMRRADRTEETAGKPDVVAARKPQPTAAKAIATAS